MKPVFFILAFGFLSHALADEVIHNNPRPKPPTNTAPGTLQWGAPNHNNRRNTLQWGAPGAITPSLTGAESGALRQHFRDFLNRRANNSGTSFTELPPGWDRSFEFFTPEEKQRLRDFIISRATNPDPALRRLAQGWELEFSPLTQAQRQEITNFVRSLRARSEQRRNTNAESVPRTLPPLVQANLHRLIRDEANYTDGQFQLPDNWERQHSALNEAQRNHVVGLVRELGEHPWNNFRAIGPGWEANLTGLSDMDLQKLRRLERLLVDVLPSQGAVSTPLYFDHLLQNLSHESIDAAMRLYDPEYQRYHVENQRISELSDFFRTHFQNRGAITPENFPRFEELARLIFSKDTLERLNTSRTGETSQGDMEFFQRSMQNAFRGDGQLRGDALREAYTRFREQWANAPSDADTARLREEHPFLSKMAETEFNLRQGALQNFLRSQPDAAAATNLLTQRFSTQQPSPELAQHTDPLIQNGLQILNSHGGENGQVQPAHQVLISNAFRRVVNQASREQRSCSDSTVMSTAQATADSWRNQLEADRRQLQHSREQAANCLRPFQDAKNREEREIKYQMGTLGNQVRLISLRLTEINRLLAQAQRLVSLLSPSSQFSQLAASERTPRNSAEAQAITQRSDGHTRGEEYNRNVALKNQYQEIKNRTEGELRNVTHQYDQIMNRYQERMMAWPLQSQTELERCQGQAANSAKFEPDSLTSFVRTAMDRQLRLPNWGATQAEQNEVVAQNAFRYQVTQGYTELTERARQIAQLLVREHKTFEEVRQNPLYQQWVSDIDKQPCPTQSRSALLSLFETIFRDTNQTMRDYDSNVGTKMAELRRKWNIRFNGLEPDFSQAEFFRGSWEELSRDLNSLTELLGRRPILTADQFADYTLQFPRDYKKQLEDQFLNTWMLQGNNPIVGVNERTAADVEWDPETRSLRVKGFRDLSAIRTEIASTARLLEIEMARHQEHYRNYRNAEDQWWFAKGTNWASYNRNGLWGLLGYDVQAKSLEQQTFEQHQRNMRDLLDRMGTYGRLSGGLEAPVPADEMFARYDLEWRSKMRFANDDIRRDIHEDAESRFRQSLVLAGAMVIGTPLVAGYIGAAAGPLLAPVINGLASGIRFHHMMGLGQTTGHLSTQAYFGTPWIAESSRIGQGELEQWKTALMFAGNHPWTVGYRTAVGMGAGAVARTTGSLRGAASLLRFSRASGEMAGMLLSAAAVDATYDIVHNGRDATPAISSGLVSGGRMALLGAPPLFRVGNSALMSGVKSVGRLYLYDSVMFGYDTYLAPGSADVRRDMEERDQNVWQRYRETITRNILMYVQSGKHGMDGHTEAKLRDNVNRIGRPLDANDRVQMRNWNPRDIPPEGAVMTFRLAARLAGEAHRPRGPLTQTATQTPSQVEAITRQGQAQILQHLSHYSYLEFINMMERNPTYRQELAEYVGVPEAELNQAIRARMVADPPKSSERLLRVESRPIHQAIQQALNHNIERIVGELRNSPTNAVRLSHLQFLAERVHSGSPHAANWLAHAPSPDMFPGFQSATGGPGLFSGIARLFFKQHTGNLNLSENEFVLFCVKSNYQIPGNPRTTWYDLLSTYAAQNGAHDIFGVQSRFFNLFRR